MENPSSLPAHLAAHEAAGLKTGEPIAQFELGDYRNFVYLILDWGSGGPEGSREAAIVDPQLDLDMPLNALRENGFVLTKILLTHTHHDHIAGVPGLLKLNPGLEVLVHEDDAHRLSRMRAPLRKVRDGETIQVGAVAVRVLHTPGHSAGECSYFIEKPRPYLFTGDTIFIRDCGRTDLETGSNEQMYASIQRVKMLPGETVILPGHHYARECASTIAREMEDSPPFRCGSVGELASLP